MSVHFVKTTSKRLSDKGSWWGWKTQTFHLHLVPPVPFWKLLDFLCQCGVCFTMWEMSFVQQLFIKPASLPCSFSPASFKHSRHEWKQREGEKKSTSLLITKYASLKRRGARVAFCDVDSPVILQPWGLCIPWAELELSPVLCASSKPGGSVRRVGRCWVGGW